MTVISWAVSAILIQNVILSRFLGTCPFLGVSKKRNSALGMGIAVTFVIGLSSVVCWILYKFVLVQLNMVYMRTIVFILVIASLVQIIEIFIKKVFPSLYRSLGIYLPLITTNCAVLGMATIVSGYESFWQVLIVSIGSGIGFLAAIYIFSSIREKLDLAPVPVGFKGIGVALLTAGIMAMIVARFSGVI